MASLLTRTSTASPRPPALAVVPGVAAGLRIPARALALVVNSTDDTEDGTCDEVHCSLREALADAAYYPGPHTITFDILTSDPGYSSSTGVWTIQPNQGFVVPPDTTVDGSVEITLASLGTAIVPRIEIDGALASSGAIGLQLNNDITLRGLIVNNLQYGIWVGKTNVTIEYCYVGTDPTGTSAKPNRLDGILIAGGVTGAVIQKNLLSGNASSGIRVFGETTSRNRMRANRIGTDATGKAPLPNDGYGIRLHAGAHHNTIGPNNVIAFNDADGVNILEAGTRANTITRNRIHKNGFAGIRLVKGGNDELAEPVILIATGAEVTGTACPGCLVEIFSYTEDEVSAFEGDAVADGDGAWAFTVAAGLSGTSVMATATDSAGNTSAFSWPARVYLSTVYVPFVKAADVSLTQ